MFPLSDSTKSQGKGGLSEAMWGFQGKGPVGSSPYSPPGTFSALCVAYGGGEGDLPGPHELAARTAWARLVAH